MSYQVLARKWRPRSFTEMVGQEHVLRALINGLDNDRLHHAYLFTGTRGVGKTTLARILAKCLNCDEGVSSTPCGVCSSCCEINEGRFVDLIEVDAASRTKVEDTRELLENVQYLPTRGRYKVYLIDEVHMLSNNSFNALLKTLEEPPPHVKFLLATTDPQKLPVTVLSRCLQFNLKNLGPERIVSHLEHVLTEEKIPFEESALWALGRAADGSMRDALSLTDQAIAHGGGALTAAEVNAMLGTIDRAAVVDICRAVAAGDVGEVMASVNDLSEHSPDYDAALADMLTFWHQVAVAQALPDGLDSTQEHRDTIIELAGILSREDVQLCYQICLLGRRDLSLAADPRSGFEMVLLRLLAFKPKMPDQAAEPPTANRQGSEAVVPAKKSETVPDTFRDKPVPRAEPEARQVPSPSVEEKPVELVAAKPEAPAKISEHARAEPEYEFSSAQVSAAVSQESGERAEPSTERIALEQVSPESWFQVCQGIGNGGLMQNLASDMVVSSVDNSTIRLVLNQDNSALFNEGLGQRLQDTLSTYFGKSVTLDITIAQVSGETPRMVSMRQREEKKQKALASLREDPNVQFLVREFDGELVESSVKSLD